jgi:meso-butanediol dehydrogenase / (S,S)-butanediol dehydrogenase / diacetyl reductase
MNALVTGAATGIGAAIARELVRRDYRVAVTDIDEEAAAKLGAELETFHARLDVTDSTSVEQAASSAEQALGPLSLWVCNAGVSTMRRFVDVGEEEWDRTFDVNTKGVFLCGREAARRMSRGGQGGAIVNLASMAGKQGRVPFLSHYVASKFAVIGLTQAMAYELAPLGIRVNSVCPGYVATSMQEREVAWEAELRGLNPDEIRRLYINDTPMGRLETPEDVARVVAFLAGADAGFITGEAVSVNGGAFMD